MELFDQAKLAIDQKDWSLAIRKCREAHALFPKSSLWTARQSLLATALRDSGASTDAKAALQKLKEKAPQDPYTRSSIEEFAKHPEVTPQ